MFKHNLFLVIISLSMLLCSATVSAETATPIPIEPLSDVLTASPVFIWQDLSGASDFRLRIHDRLLRERVHVQTYSRDEICVESICAVQPDVVLGFSSSHVWYVRAFDSAGRSDWIKSTFSFSAPSPAAATLIDPLGEIQTTTPEFIWVHNTGVEQYRLHVRDLTVGKNALLRDYEATDICAEAECRIVPSDLELPENHEFFFRVRAENSGGRSDWSDVNEFDVLPQDLALSPVSINEFLVSNQSGLLDNTGDNSDWIELHNASDSLVELTGWTLTAGNDTHVFEETHIEAGAYLVIFASGKPSRSIEGELHVDFKLSADGESLVLSDDTGASIAPQWPSTYPPQMPDISYGVDTNAVQFFYSQPTPGEPNNVGLAGFVEPVSFSLNSGFYDVEQLLTLSTETPSATIHYTTDGSVPTVLNGNAVASGTEINVSQTTVLRAIAARSGWGSSPTGTKSYLFAAEIARRSEITPSGWPDDREINNMQTFYGMDANLSAGDQIAVELALTAIPAISIVTDLENLFNPTTGIWAMPRRRGGDWERPAFIELIDPTDAEIGFEINGGFRVKGNSSRNPANFKHSMRLVFNDAYGDGELVYPLHGADAVDVFESLNLKTSQSWSWNSANANRHPGRGPEATWLRDVWSRQTQGAMGHLYTKSEYVNLFLNGRYWGLYYTEERVSNQLSSQYLGGDENDYDIIKPDTTGESNPIEARDGTVDAWVSMWPMVEDHVLSDEEWARFQNEVDVVNLADYYLLMWVSGDSDSSPRFTLDLSNNWLAVRDRTGEGSGGKWHFVDTDSESALCTNVEPERAPDWNPTPPWNLDASLGFNISDEFHLAPAWLMEAALTRTEFVEIFKQRVQLHLQTPGGALTVDESVARLDSLISSVNTVIDAEAARWGNTRIDPGFNRINWETAAQNVRDCFALRTSVIIEYLEEDGLVF